jgi:predicted nucleic acid-binding protein
MAHEVFIDAGAWIALNDRGDRFHPSAVGYYQRVLRERRSLVTTNLVIAEAYINIRRAGGYQPAMRFLDSTRQSSRLTRVYSDAGLEAEADKLLRRYADQDFSLTDAVSFAVMQQRGITEAFAFDRHFVTAGFALMPTAQKMSNCRL